MIGTREEWARREPDRYPDKIVCFACDYDRIPESGSWLGSKAIRDVCSPIKQLLKRNKGRARINFSKPIDFFEAAGEGSVSECSSRLAEMCQEEVKRLIVEAQDYRMGL